MNCSEALLEAVAKYAFEIGLKPLSETEIISVNICIVSLILLLLFAEAVFVIKKLETVEDVLHSDQWIRKVLNTTRVIFKSFASTYVFVHSVILFFKFKSYNY